MENQEEHQEKDALSCWRLHWGGSREISISETAQAARAIEELKPDIVAVNICRECHEPIIGQEDAEEDLEIHALLGGSKMLLFLMQMLMTFSYKKIQDDGSANPGSEMLAAIVAARKAGARLESLDGNESEILDRFWTSMSFLDKLRLLCFMIQVKLGRRKDEIQNDSLISNDALSQMISDITLFSPAASDALKRERDSYLAGKLLQFSREGRVLVVVDAGHQDKITELLAYPEAAAVKVETKREPGREISRVKILGAALTLLVLAGMALVLVNAQSSEKMVLAFIIWFAITGGLSALGVILARGHPLSAFTALMVAWFTTLIPFIAAGLFAGTVEAWKQKPTVGDLGRLGRASSLDQMMQNRLFKVVLVTVMANLGGMAGMLLGIYIIWQRLGLMNPTDFMKGLL